MSTYSLPRDLMNSHDIAAAALSPSKYIRSPKFQRLKDMWCAARFALGYERHVRPCLVRVNDVQASDTDFFIQSCGAEFPFQTIIADVPGRRMGDEYLPTASTSLPYEPERGRTEGPAWIAEAIQRKLEKRYAEVHELNLLVYANFSAHHQTAAAFRTAITSYGPRFASIWVMNNHQLCSLYSTPQLGSVDSLSVVEQWPEQDAP